jgi:hypothetical protein
VPHPFVDSVLSIDHDAKSFSLIVLIQLTPIK